MLISYTRSSVIFLLETELSPLKVLERFGLSARGSHSELRGKLVLGLGASLEAIPLLLRVFPIKAPYYI